MIITKTLELEVSGVGEKIQNARKRSIMPLTKICREIGMSTMNWYRIEREQQTVPIDTLRRIEEILEVDLNINFKQPVAA